MPPAVEIRFLSPTPVKGITYTSDEPDSSVTNAIHGSSGDRRPPHSWNRVRAMVLGGGFPSGDTIQISRPVSRLLSSTTSHLPSEDQSVATCGPFRAKTTAASSLPSVLFTYRSLAPARSELNTTWRPSRDQIGLDSSVISEVNRLATRRDRSNDQMSDVPTCGSVRSARILCPSGEIRMLLANG